MNVTAHAYQVLPFMQAGGVALAFALAGPLYASIPERLLHLQLKTCSHGHYAPGLRPVQKQFL